MSTRTEAEQDRFTTQAWDREGRTDLRSEYLDDLFSRCVVVQRAWVDLAVALWRGPNLLSK